MGLLSDAWRFLTFQNLPAARIDRAASGMLDERAANGMTVIGYQRGRPQYPNRNPVTYDQDAYRKVALIFRCVNLLAAAIASAPLRVYEERDGQKQELSDHALRQLIVRPNQHGGEVLFKAQVAMNLAVTGFCVIEKVRSEAGRVVELYPLRSDWVLPVLRDQAPPDWEYRVPGNRPVLLKAEDVLVPTFADTADYRPTGIGPLEIALREWGILNSMQDFLKGFFDGGGLPVYGLIPDPEADLNQEDADLLAEKWIEKTLWSPGQRQRPPILKSIKGIQRLSFDYNELAYVDLRNVAELAVCQAFGINPSMASQMFGIEHNTFSNVKESRQSFYEDTIVPLWARLDDLFTYGLLAEFEPNPAVSIEFDTSGIAAMQEDAVAKRAHLLDAFKAGAITRAQYKRAAQIEIDAGADDVYLIPFNLIEVPAGKKQAAQRSVSGHVLNINQVQLGDVPLLAAHLKAKALPDPDVQRRARGLVTMATRERIATRANAQFVQGGRSFGPRVQAFLQDQKGRVLAALDQRAAVWPVERRDIADLINLDWATEDELLDEIIRALWDTLGQSAANDAAALIGSDAITWNVSNPWVNQVLSLVATRVTGVNETTRNDIREVVGEALNDGVSIDNLKDRLTGLYDETYNGRSQTIARTESMVAYNEATAAGYAESGEVEEIELHDSSTHSEPYGAEDGWSCTERNGQIVPLANARLHIRSEHPNGSLAFIPILAKPLGEV